MGAERRYFREVCRLCALINFLVVQIGESFALGRGWNGTLRNAFIRRGIHLRVSRKCPVESFAAKLPSLPLFLCLSSFWFNWLISDRIEGLLGNDALTGRRDFRFSLVQPPLGRSSAPGFFARRKSLKSFNRL